MDSTLLYYALGIVIVIALVLYRTRNRPDAEIDSLYDVLEQYQDAIDIAPQIVAGVEQLWLTGAIPDKNERLNEAMRRLGELTPMLSEKQLRTIIEGAVWLAKQSTVQIVTDGGNETQPFFPHNWN